MKRALGIFLCFIFCLVACNDEDTDMNQFPNPPFMQPLPPGPGLPAVPRSAWSAHGAIRRAVATDEVGLQQSFAEPGTYTIQFGLMQNPLEIEPVFVEADITWMVQGNQSTRRVTVAEGMSISGTGEAVQIRVRDVSPAAGAVPDPLLPYTVTILVTKGVRAAVSPPFYVPEGARTLAAAATGIWLIPPRIGAKTVQVLVASVVPGGTPIADNQAFVRQISASGFDCASYDPRYFDWVPLCNNPTQVRVTNFTANQMQVTVIYGIDG